MGYRSSAMRCLAVMTIIVVVSVGTLLFLTMRPQVWVGHAKIHQNPYSYVG